MIIIIVISLLIVLATILYIRKNLLVTSIVSIIWLVIMLLSSIVYPVDIASGYWFVMLSLFLLCLGEYLIIKDVERTSKDIYIYSKYIRYIVIILTVFGLLYSILLIYDYGFSLKDLLNIYDYKDMCYTIYRNQKENNSIIFFLLLMCVYLNSIISGFMILRDKRKIAYLSFIIPILFKMIIDTTKATFILSLVLFFSSMLISHYLSKGEYINISKKSVVVFIFCLVLFFVLLIVFIWLRNVDNIVLAINKFYQYAFGGIYNFNKWFIGNDSIIIQYGKQTYMGIASKISIVKDVQYETIQQTNSNIYTSYRGLIEDYGKIVTLLIYFIKGLIIGHMEKNIGNKSLISIVILLSEIVFLICGLIVSPWKYSTIIGSIVIFLLFLFTFTKYEK